MFKIERASNYSKKETLACKQELNDMCIACLGWLGDDVGLTLPALCSFIC